MTFSKEFLYECDTLLKHILENEELINNIEEIVDILLKTRNNKGRLFIIGSGGGAGHASHAVNDFRKLCNIESYAPYDNVSELTARINDDGWDTTIFNWLHVSNLKKEDCVFVISVGGGDYEKNISMNIVKAAQYANEIGSAIVGIVGREGGYTKKVGGKSVIVIPNLNNKLVTPLTEGFQAVLWHLIVSHPKLKINETKW